MSNWNDIFPHWGHQIRLPSHLLEFVSTSPSDNDERRFAEWVEAQPKCELHVHMEAAVSEQFYALLNLKHKLYDESLLPAKRAPFSSLRDFISAWIDNTKLISNASDYFNLAREFVRLRAAQNIVYSEAHVSPVDFSFMRKRFGFAQPLSFRECLTEILKGLKSAEDEWPQVEVRLIVDALWICSEEEHAALFDELKDCCTSPANRNKNGQPFIVGVGFGGPEVSANAERISAGFMKRCRDELGLKIDIHSGESVTSQDHRHSVETANPHRVGHGISGFEDGFVFSGHIATNPLSNILTNSWQRKLNEHPIQKLFARGHSISLNSDDPLLFGTTLTLEYVAMRKAFGFEKEFFAETQKQAMNSKL